MCIKFVNDTCYVEEDILTLITLDSNMNVTHPCKYDTRQLQVFFFKADVELHMSPDPLSRKR